MHVPHERRIALSVRVLSEVLILRPLQRRRSEVRRRDVDLELAIVRRVRGFCDLEPVSTPSGELFPSRRGERGNIVR